ncbi:MAG: ribosomal-protein-alanine acetyltransferase [Chloroflexi bacterium]|nr:ribosomal-protein-alanine acetyltransferase [Chloroflexota bacterium]
MTTFRTQGVHLSRDPRSEPELRSGEPARNGASTHATSAVSANGMLDPTAYKYVVEPMAARHIPAVSAIERDSFPSIWPASAYRREIERNDMAYYVVAKRTPLAGPARRPRRFPVLGVDTTPGDEGLLSKLGRLVRGEKRAYATDEAEELETIVGYSGMWAMGYEAHVTTIAVDPPYRGEAIGELLLVALLEEARSRDAETSILECRVSNHVAQALYRKYTYRDGRVRKGYYSDDGEDAIEMSTVALDSRTFRETLAENRKRLLLKLQGTGDG